ncbi:Alanine racemase [Trichinella spiralis]|uniref:Alanine racemase n=1 Tax=Trichinella spiralis TaxID=6334 RepID=A0ABR3KJK5_TRISP
MPVNKSNKGDAFPCRESNPSHYTTWDSIRLNVVESKYGCWPFNKILARSYGLFPCHAANSPVAPGCNSCEQCSAIETTGQ